MMLKILLTALAAAPLLASCSTYSGWSSTPSRIILAENDYEDGASVEYRLVYSGLEDISIHKDATEMLALPLLGVSVSSLDTEAARTFGVKAWRGVAITSVTAGSAAAKAGLTVGDILIAINGETLGSTEQFSEVMRSFEPYQEVELFLASVGAPGAGRVERSLVAQIGAREVEETSTTRIPVEADEGVFRHTGLVTALIPADLALEVYGSETPAVLIAAVASGSGAYSEGFRGGDRVLRCNGVDVTGMGPLIEASQPDRDGIQLEVDGPLGPHSGTFPVVRDVVVTKEFDIPILFDYSTNVSSTETSFLDFIFQFGFNYRRKALVAPTTREPLSSRHLSILPFGMFEFTRKPGYSKNRIFWFISWYRRS